MPSALEAQQKAYYVETSFHSFESIDGHQRTGYHLLFVFNQKSVTVRQISKRKALEQDQYEVRLCGGPEVGQKILGDHDAACIRSTLGFTLM